MKLLTTGSLLLLVACATPEFAQFSPLPATIVGHREARPLWSLVVPDGWQVRNSDDDVLYAFEAPPKNGRHLVYRTLHVATAAAVAADDDAGLGEAAQRLLIERRTNDELVVQERGAARLAGRDAWFMRGTMRGPAAGWTFDVLDYCVPGTPVSLVISFTAPAPQLAASRAGFAAIAATLETSLGAPRLRGGDAQRLDGGRLTLRLPAAWQRLDDGAGNGAELARFRRGGAECNVSTRLGDAPLLAQFAEAAAKAPNEARDFRLLSIDRSPRGGHRAVRVRSAWRGAAGTVIADDTAVLAGAHLDVVSCRVPAAEFAELAPEIDRALTSLRWQ